MKDRSTLMTIIMSTIFFVLGIVATVIMEKKYRPVYSVINSPSLIYDNKNSSPRIKLMLEDSILVQENVYVTTLAFWNKGNEEIKSENVRRPVLLFCSDSIGRILDYKIVQQIDPELSNFRLVQKGDSIRIDWDYFDPKGGCKIQVIYLGKDNTEILMNGRIGMRSIHKEKVSNGTTRDRRLMLNISPLLALLWVGLIFSYYHPKSQYFKDKKALTFSIVIVGGVSILWIISITDIIFVGIPF